MPAATIRQDGTGLFFIGNGVRFRPGELYLFPSTMRHDDGGLIPGQRTKYRLISGMSAAYVRADDGGETIWETEDCKEALTLRQSATPEQVRAGRELIDQLFPTHPIIRITP